MLRDPAQLHWERAVRALAWRINFVGWLDRAAPLLFGAGAVAGFSLYALRRTSSPEVGISGVWWLATGLGLTATALATWWRARKTFLKPTDARALLEHRMGLDSALSAAAVGVTAWPEPRPVPRRLLRWHARATVAWLAGALTLALAGASLPVPPRGAFDPREHTEKPPALVQAEEWLDKLAEQEIARPEDVDKLAEQARGLGERTPEERYSHSGLEAADTLRSQTAQAIRGLGAELEDAASALAALERPAGQLSDEELGAVAARLGEALRGLQEGPLSAREELIKKLGSAANAAGLRSLSPEQATQLRQQLAKAGRAATGVLGAHGQGANVASADPNSPACLGHGGLCKGNGTGNCEGNGFGNGSVSRGPGHAPLYFNEEASDAGAGKTETVSAEDLSRAALGELLGMERGEHEFDPKTSAAPTAAGSVSGAAQGGEVVWVDRLTPRERASLKEFFK